MSTHLIEAANKQVCLVDLCDIFPCIVELLRDVPASFQLQHVIRAILFDTIGAIFNVEHLFGVAEHLFGVAEHLCGVDVSLFICPMPWPLVLSSSFPTSLL
jgi:hypothetical protein